MILRSKDFEGLSFESVGTFEQYNNIFTKFSFQLSKPWNKYFLRILPKWKYLSLYFAYFRTIQCIMMAMKVYLQPEQ